MIEALELPDVKGAFPQIRKWEIRKNGQPIGHIYDEDLAEVINTYESKVFDILHTGEAPRYIHSDEAFMEQYVKDAIRTESVVNDFSLGQNLNGDTTWISSRLMHGIIGLTTEVGEFWDQVKRYIFYGKPLDKVNLQEELGDMFWYLAILSNHLGIDFRTIMERNIAKLKKRFPDKYSDEKALNRDLVEERKALEGKEA